MSESLTEGAVQTPASVEPTGQDVQQTTTAESNQEAISGVQTQENAANDTAVQQNNEGGDNSSADDGLAKFAKGQGIEDLTTLSEREKQLLKVAHDNVRENRNQNQNQPKLTDASKDLGKPADDATEVQKLAYRVAQFEAAQKTDQFFSTEGRDRNVEAQMVQVLRDKEKQFGKEYAYSLSQDLDTLYAMASLQSGANSSEAAKQAGRQEEREAINKQNMAGAPTAHAVAQSATGTKIDRQWIEDVYKPGNPEHEALLSAAMANGDLK